MSKKNEFFSGFHHLAITKRITLLYGGLFTLSLLFLSLFMLWNIPDMQKAPPEGNCSMPWKMYSSIWIPTKC